MSEENKDLLLDDSSNGLKERHGCVSAWLILMMIGGVITAVMYLFTSDLITDALPVAIPQGMLIVLGLLGLLNIVFAVMLWQWKKIGFFGFAGITAVSLVINLYLSLGLTSVIGGVLGLVLLYGILQITKNGTSAWEQLE